MQNSVFKMRLFFLILSCCVLTSCSLIKSTPNDFLFRKESLKNAIDVSLDTFPSVRFFCAQFNGCEFIKKSPDENSVWIRNQIEKKLVKKNIHLTNDDNQIIKIKVNKIFFKEMINPTGVYSDKLEFLGNYDKVIFSFNIQADIYVDNVLVKKINYENEHETDPRESYLIPGAIVYDGYSVNVDKLLSNWLNYFCSEIFEVLEDVAD